MRVLKIGADLRLNDQVLNSIRDFGEYEGVMISGQRPYTEDAAYLLNEFENSRIPRTIMGEDEIESIFRRRNIGRSRTNSGVIIAMYMAAMAAGPYTEALRDYERIIRSLHGPNKNEEYIISKNKKRVPDNRYHPRQNFDKRNYRKR